MIKATPSKHSTTTNNGYDPRSGQGDYKGKTPGLMTPQEEALPHHQTRPSAASSSAAGNSFTATSQPHVPYASSAGSEGVQYSGRNFDSGQVAPETTPRYKKDDKVEWLDNTSRPYWENTGGIRVAWLTAAELKNWRR
ncbi:hypothetical protein MMC20_005280 [Loxospora ochrophaea]|nr:hypothetical protein [Loxospora ochrophaea]